MPGAGEIKREISVASYQNFDGSNTTMGLYNVNYQAGAKISLTGAAGCSTNFKSNPALVFEAKGKYNFDDNTSVQVRIRSSHSDNTNTTQFRISPGYKENLGKTTSIYINPYAAAKVNYDTGKWTTDLGAFAGVTQKINNNVSVSVEAQRYDMADLKNNSSKNWGVNAILSWKF